MTLLGELIADFYTRHPTGGRLHVVLDDLNVEDRFIESCLGDEEFDCYEEDCPKWCDVQASLIGAMLLLDLEESERAEIIKEATNAR